MIGRPRSIVGLTCRHLVQKRLSVQSHLAILTRWARVGSYVAMPWLILIAVSLISAGPFLDFAVRDLEMAIAAYTLARLTEVRLATDAQSLPIRGHASNTVLAR